MEPQLLGDDRSIRLDQEGPTLDAKGATGAVGRGGELRNDLIERGDRPAAPKLLAEAEPGRGLRDEIADPCHRAAAGPVGHANPRARPAATWSVGSAAVGWPGPGSPGPG